MVDLRDASRMLHLQVLYVTFSRLRIWKKMWAPSCAYLPLLRANLHFLLQNISLQAAMAIPQNRIDNHPVQVNNGDGTFHNEEDAVQH